MLYRIGKKLFEILRNILHFTQIVLIFFSFAIILYWILQIAQVPWVSMFAPVFETVKEITHLFYNRVSTVDNATIDFSFLIAAMFLLLIVWLLKYVIERIEDIEQKYDSIYLKLKKKTEDIFNITLEREYKAKETQNNKTLILVKFKLENLTKDSFFDREANKDNKQKENEFMSNFLEIVNEDFDIQTKLLNENLLFYLNDCEKIDETLDKLKQVIKNLKQKYHEERWEVTAFVSLDVYAKTNEIIPKVQKLVLLNKLGLKNKIACLSSFKQRYSLLKETKYKLEVEGMYKLGENNEEVSVIKT